MDLANGHVKAVEYAASHKGVEVFNLGTGTPYSVLDIIHAFEKATGVKVKYEIGPRRHRMYLAGMRNEHWKTCAGIHGTGRLRIQKDIRNSSRNNVVHRKDITREIRLSGCWSRTFWSCICP